MSETESKTIFYEKAIGVKGVAWGAEEKKEWFEQQTIKRSYQEEVLSKLDDFKDDFEVIQYGKLTLSVNDYPLFSVKTKASVWDNSKQTILITGGVHGYETSGVQGALRFIQTKMKAYENNFNCVVCPCVCPWGYETINRWNSDAIDPNRSFQFPNTPENNINHIEETTMLINFWESLGNTEGVVVNTVMHMDLHETTDTDVTTFGPALAARNGVVVEETTIPDGFYVVGDSDRPCSAFNMAIIRGVEKVTHLIPESDSCLGEVVVQRACFNAPGRMLGLCMGFTTAPYVSTTEVYPDSPSCSDEECILAQVAAVSSGLDHILQCDA